MPSQGLQPLGNPADWVAAVERIGIFNSVALIIALGIAIAFASRGPGMIKEVREIINTLLAHSRIKKDNQARIDRENANLAAAIERRKAKAVKRGDRL